MNVFYYKRRGVIGERELIVLMTLIVFRLVYRFEGAIPLNTLLTSMFRITQGPADVVTGVQR